MIQRFRFDIVERTGAREQPHPSTQTLDRFEKAMKHGTKRMSENKSYIRYKRKNGRIHSWPCKLYVPVTLRTKNRFADVARMNRLSQAELGAVVVMHYLEDQQLMTQAIQAYQKEKKATESDSLQSRYLKE